MLRGHVLPEKSAMGAYGSRICSKFAFAAGRALSGKRMASMVLWRVSANPTSNDSSGMARPFSHLLTAWGLIFSRPASSSWVRPMFFLKSAIFWPAFTLSNIFILLTILLG